MKKITFSLLMLLFSGLATGQSVTVVFSVKAPPAGAMDRVGIRGSAQPLSWEQTLWLTPAENSQDWQAEVTFASEDDLVEYKYVVENQKGEITWELDGADNRLLLLDGVRKTPVLNETWNVPRPIDPARLPKISVAALAEDLAILKRAYTDLHPGLYRYNEPTEMEAHFADLERAFSRPLSYAEAYLEISKFLGKIRCGHTYANFFNQSGLIQQIILGGKDKIPFAFEWVDRRMIVAKNALAQPALAPGTEVLAINDVPVARILDSLLTVVKADGANDAKRLSDLEVRGYDYFEAFDVYFPLFFPPLDGHYHIEGRNLRTGALVQATVEAVTRRERTARLQERYGDLPTSLDELWSFKLLDEQTGYLKLGTFTVWNFEMDWKAFLKDAFRTLDKQQVPHLIIDIRGNEGGVDEVIYELGRYLLKSPCTVETYQERVRYEKIPDDLRPYLFTWDQSVFDLTGQVNRLDDRFYIRKDADAATQEFSVSKKAYAGQVCFLVDAANSSGAFYLARLAKACGIGTLVGQTTGGSQQGLNAGIMLFLRLPNSRIEADIPLLGTFARSPQPTGGIVPDIVVKPDVKAILEGRDLEVEAVLRKIGQ